MLVTPSDICWPRSSLLKQAHAVIASMASTTLLDKPRRHALVRGSSRAPTGLRPASGSGTPPLVSPCQRTSAPPKRTSASASCSLAGPCSAARAPRRQAPASRSSPWDDACSCCARAPRCALCGAGLLESAAAACQSRTVDARLAAAAASQVRVSSSGGCGAARSLSGAISLCNRAT